MSIYRLLFEWDEAKRLANLARHGLDFIDARLLFDGRAVFSYPSARSGELRFVTVGTIETKYYAVVWTNRGRSIRLISFRRARDAEERKHRSRHG